MKDDDAPVVIVGASLAGLRSLEGLRKGGFEGPVVVIGDESHPPYNRPPLSKSHPVPHLDDLVFRMPRNQGDTQWRLGERVTSADLAQRTITVGGERLTWKGLVCATGLRPRKSPVVPGERRHAVRTIADARALADHLSSHDRVTVIGAGFLGMEMAAMAAELGREVVVIARSDEVMSHVVGPSVGAALRARHEARGVRFLLGRTVVADRFESGVHRLQLDDGMIVESAIVVEAIGSVAETSWLDGNGLDLSDGVLCDAELRVLGAVNVVACGDVARWPNPRIDPVPRRVEQWTVAGESGKAAGANLAALLGGEHPAAFAPLPSFWSDQYEFRVQGYGAPHLADEVTLERGEWRGDFVAEYSLAGRPIGAVMVGMTGAMLEVRTRVDRDFLPTVPQA